jgi:trimeric autotransporter adhesin
VVGGGEFNTASGTLAAIPGGESNIASGARSLAAGEVARATHDHSFVWCDGSAATADGADREFVARASGGVAFRSASNDTTGVSLPSGGGSWLTLSDRHAKRGLRPVSGRAVLRKLQMVPIATWSDRTEKPSIRHSGPIAQTFHRRFDLGESRRYIADVDAQGVALAAIKGAAARIHSQHRALVAQRAANRTQDKQIATLKREVERLSRR